RTNLHKPREASFARRERLAQDKPTEQKERPVPEPDLWRARALLRRTNVLKLDVPEVPEEAREEAREQEPESERRTLDQEGDRERVAEGRIREARAPLQLPVEVKPIEGKTEAQSAPACDGSFRQAGERRRRHQRAAEREPRVALGAAPLTAQEPHAGEAHEHPRQTQEERAQSRRPRDDIAEGERGSPPRQKGAQ